MAAGDLVMLLPLDFIMLDFVLAVVIVFMLKGYFDKKKSLEAVFK